MQFGFDQYQDHDFYHLRLGRGALVVAVKKTPRLRDPLGRINSDGYVASIFASRTQKIGGDHIMLDPILSIKEEDEMVEMTISFSRWSDSIPSSQPVDAIIKRRLPSSQVTFEVVERNDSEQP